MNNITELWCKQLCTLSINKDPQFELLCKKICKEDLKKNKKDSNDKEIKNNKKSIFEISRR